jgi:hypothetical protein
MAKYYSEFDWWCILATKKIKYRQDRQTVYGELYQHIEDRYLDFLEEGMDKEQAIKRTLEVMGSAAEIAPQLAAIHRPFWGYLYSLCKWGLIALLLVTVWKFVPWVTNFLEIHEPGWNISGYDIYKETYFEVKYDGKVQDIWNRIYYAEPDIKVSSDEYSFSVSKVFLWEISDVIGEEQGTDYHLYILMDSTNPLPWADFVDIGSFFWAEDNHGTYYYSSEERLSGNEPYVAGGNPKHLSGLFTHTYRFACKLDTADTEWIELHYDRAGRDITLHIDLTGGDIP